MTSQSTPGPVQLEPLRDVIETLEGEYSGHKLLSHCIDQNIQTYFPVPPGQVVAVFPYAVKQSRRSLFHVEKPYVEVLGQADIDRRVKLVVLDGLDLRDIRDKGEVALTEFLCGGLVAGGSGLIYFPFEYAVMRKDSPTFFGERHAVGSERLFRGQVHAVKQDVRLADLFVGVDDGQKLRKLFGPKEVKDRWDHKGLAPSIFRIYSATQRPYDADAIRDELLANDDKGVFILASATAAASIIKVDVQEKAVKGFAVHKISDNEVGKDYADPSLSKRMSLLLLATDCWIHDRQCQDEMEARVVPIRDAFVQKREDPNLNDEEREELDIEMARVDFAEQAALKEKLYMPNGLAKYLEVLGFSSNQAGHLVRIITENKEGGVHAETTRKVAARRKSGKK
jgi:hypothetical protein